MSRRKPKILIVKRSVWDDEAGTSSTEANLFGDYNTELLSHLYIETKAPRTIHCRSFFQISEYALIKRIWNWKIRTGKEIQLLDDYTTNEAADNEVKERRIMNFVRRNRSLVFTFIREMLWLLNGWKSHELENYLKKNKFDTVFLFGSPLILMNRLYSYVIEKVNKPVSLFIMDDIYSYKAIKGSGAMRIIYRMVLRRYVTKIVNKCDKVFVISEKMKREYDEQFNINSIVLTKSVEYSEDIKYNKEITMPIKLLYLGQIIYGRIHTLMKLSDIIEKINKEETKIQLTIRTNNHVNNKIRKRLLKNTSTYLEPPVPYHQVKYIMKESDVLVHVESFSKRYKSLSRLSFSTKISDYMGSCKCILAIGDSDNATIEYLIKYNAAIVATSHKEIEEKVQDIVLKLEETYKYAKNIHDLGRKYHDKRMIKEKLYQEIENIS